VIRTRVLLVEDDQRIRQALGLALADIGFEVVEADSGDQALDRLDHLVVDVVLLDLMLPGVDNLTVCRIPRSCGDLPIIIDSARTDTEGVIEGLESGADDSRRSPSPVRNQPSCSTAAVASVLFR